MPKVQKPSFWSRNTYFKFRNAVFMTWSKWHFVSSMLCTWRFFHKSLPGCPRTKRGEEPGASGRGAGWPRSLDSRSSAHERFPGVGSPCQVPRAAGRLATTIAWLSRRSRPPRGSTALPSGSGQGSGGGGGRSAAARARPAAISREVSAPPLPPPAPPPPRALGPRLPLWLRSGGSCGRRLGCRRLSALSSPSCHRGGGLQGRLRCCRAGPSPAARTTTRGPWLRQLGGGGAGVSWASRRRRAGGWLASCATSCMGTPEQSPRS